MDSLWEDDVGKSIILEIPGARDGRINSFSQAHIVEEIMSPAWYMGVGKKALPLENLLV